MNHHSPFFREPYPNSNDSLKDDASEKQDASISFGELVCENVKLSSCDGASSIVYTGDLIDNEDIDPEPIPVIIKESYPLGLAPHITRNPDGFLHVITSWCGEFKERLSVARESFRLQQSLFRNPSLRDIIATPRGSRSAHGTAYFMSYADQGKTLEAFVGEHQGQLNLVSCFELTAAIADAVALLHEEGYLYLDLKPSNILVQELDHASPNEPSRYRIKFFDFDSIVRKERIGETGLDISNSAEWSSYEQRHPELWNQVSEKSDVYALGAILFWLLTGEKPSLPAIGHASACDGWELRARDFQETVLGQLDSDEVAGINSLFSRSLNNNISQRIESCGEFAQEARELSSKALATKPVSIRAAEYKSAHPDLDEGIVDNLERFAYYWDDVVMRDGPIETLQEIEEAYKDYILLVEGYLQGADQVALSLSQLSDTDGPYSAFVPSSADIKELDTAVRNLLPLLAFPVPWDDETYLEARNTRRLIGRYLDRLAAEQVEFDDITFAPALQIESASHLED